MENTSVKELMEEKYTTLVPRIKLKEHEEIKNYIVLSFNNFEQTSNPEYRDCEISFDIYCHLDYWDLGNYQIRPIKIAGIIDGILNNSRLSGIGTVEFISLTPLAGDFDYKGFTLSFRTIHGNDDTLIE